MDYLVFGLIYVLIIGYLEDQQQSVRNHHTALPTKTTRSHPQAQAPQ